MGQGKVLSHCLAIAVSDLGRAEYLAGAQVGQACQAHLAVQTLLVDQGVQDCQIPLLGLQGLGCQWSPWHPPLALAERFLVEPESKIILVKKKKKIINQGRNE
jgi:hypothetical protein